MKSPPLFSLAFLLAAIPAPAEDVPLDLSAKTASIENDALRIVCDLSTGGYSGIDKQAGATAFKNARFRLDPGRRPWKSPAYTYRAEDAGAVNDECGKGRKLRFWMIPGKSYLPSRFLDISVYEGKSFVVLGWGVRNEFSHTVRLRRAEILSNGLLFDGRKPSNTKVLRSGAGAEPNLVESTWKIEADNGAMMTWREDAEAGTRRTLVAGGLHYEEFAREVEWQEGVKKWSFDGSYKFPGGAPQMTLTVWDPQGKRVEPGKTWVSGDTYYLDFVTRDPFASLEQYGALLAAVNHASPNVYDFPTLCGWAVSNRRLGEGRSLNHSPGLVAQAGVARESGVMNYTKPAFRLEPDTYCYGNQGNTQQGWWDDAHWGGKSLKPPYGSFAKFCGAVERQGGWVFTYFQGSMPSNDFAAAHPDWMLNNDISLLHVPHSHQLPLVRYDYSDPGFRAYVLAMWKRLRADGVKGIKFDYPETAWAWHGGFEDKSFTTVKAYRELFRLCREGLGPEAFIHERIIGNSTHETVPRTDVCVGLVDLQRTWGDASHFEPEMASRMGLRWFKQGKAFRYYPDSKSLFVPGEGKKKPLSPEARRSMLTLIGLLGGRIELATSFGSMTPEMLHDLTRLFPALPNGKAFRPVDMLTAKNHPRVYTYQVAPDWTQVILFNSDFKKTQTVSAPVAGDSAETGALALPADNSYHVFDFWNQRYLGILKGSTPLSADLKPGETAVYSLHKVEARPQIVGTSRHVMCGMFELRDVAWDPGRVALSFKADVVKDEPLLVSIALPEGLRVSKVETAGADATHQQKGNVATLKLDAGTKKAENVKTIVLFEKQSNP